VDGSRARLPDGTYIELVASLFSTLLPTTIMAISFLAIAILVTSQTPDTALTVLMFAGLAAAAARLTVLLRYRRRATDAALSAEAARDLQRRFAAAYLSFALIFGLFEARAFVVAAPETRMAIVGLLFGYGAGVAAGLSMRPWISVPSMLIAIVPTTILAWSYPDVSFRVTGTLLAVFLAGGIQSVLARYRHAVAEIARRQLFATLARSDHLTNLPNRLSLRERFDACVARGGPRATIAVHCLDLDRFKPVNDRYGHPTGDALLKAVSGRLQGILRNSDFASRIGGDEFVVVQTEMAHAGEAQLLARRIARTIAQPYSIDGHDISIGTSIGYAESAAACADLDRLIAQADEALCGVKSRGGGIARFEPSIVEPDLRLRA